MAETILTADGVDLCAESFGDPADPAVLLIAGAAQSMDWWEADFCLRLAGTGRRVIRYDHRDTGRSTSSPAGRPSYTAHQLSTDPLRILDALGIGGAHLVGLSMGGGIAQYLAVSSADRVRTLTLISTSPAAPGAGRDDLPPPEPRVAATFTDPAPEPDWDDRDAVIAYRVDIERPYAGRLGFDASRYRRIAAAEVDRTADMAASLSNHFVLDDAWPADAELADIRAPTLVMHGTDDPLFPIRHGEALAAEVPGARFVRLDAMGHEVPPPPLWDLTVASIAEHSASAPR